MMQISARVAATPAPMQVAATPGSGVANEVAVEDLTVRYRAEPAILEKVSFNIPSGQIVALVGANGAGKSSLLRCCLGLVPPAAGRVRLLGVDMAGSSPKALAAARSRCGFIAQKHNLVPRLSVLSNVVQGLLGARGGPRYWTQAVAPERARIMAMASLSRVGLAHLAERRADRLSGGQSQRVAIARALVGSPSIVFADEPAASLDPAAGTEVMNLLLALARETKTTVIFTSHQIEHALLYSDRVLGLREKGLFLDAAPRDLQHERLLCLYE